MRRLMLAMSQKKLADGLGITFQQVQKYEQGINRIAASRLQEIARILQVPILSFFDGAPESPNVSTPINDGLPPYVAEYLASADGMRLTRSFTRIKSSRLRRRVVALVEQIADRDAG